MARSTSRRPPGCGCLASQLSWVAGVTVVAGSESTFEHLDLQFADSKSDAFDDAAACARRSCTSSPDRTSSTSWSRRCRRMPDCSTPFVLRPGADGYAEAVARQRLGRLPRHRRRCGARAARRRRGEVAGGVHPVRPRRRRDGCRSSGLSRIRRRTRRIPGHRLLPRRLARPAGCGRRLRRRPLRVGHHAPRARRCGIACSAGDSASARTSTTTATRTSTRLIDEIVAHRRRAERADRAAHRARRHPLGRRLRGAAVRAPDPHRGLGSRRRGEPFAAREGRLWNAWRVDSGRQPDASALTR